MQLVLAGKPALLLQPHPGVQNPGFSIAHPSTWVMGGGVAMVSWGWRWGGGFALIWKSLWCRGRGHLQRCYMWQVFGKFLPHPSGVRVKQILLQTSWHQGVKRKQCKASCNLFMKVPPGILQEAPWPKSSVLSSRSSCWQAAPALGPREGGWCCPSALVWSPVGPFPSFLVPGVMWVAMNVIVWLAGVSLGVWQCPEAMLLLTAGLLTYW